MGVAMSRIEEEPLKARISIFGFHPLSKR